MLFAQKFVYFLRRERHYVREMQFGVSRKCVTGGIMMDQYKQNDQNRKNNNDQNRKNNNDQNRKNNNDQNRKNNNDQNRKNNNDLF